MVLCWEVSKHCFSITMKFCRCAILKKNTSLKFSALGNFWNLLQDSYINFSSCWWKNIEQVKNLGSHQSAACLKSVVALLENWRLTATSGSFTWIRTQQLLGFGRSWLVSQCQPPTVSILSLPGAGREGAEPHVGPAAPARCFSADPGDITPSY